VRCVFIAAKRDDTQKERQKWNGFFHWTKHGISNWKKQWSWSCPPSLSKSCSSHPTQWTPGPGCLALLSLIPATVMEVWRRRRWLLAMCDVLWQREPGLAGGHHAAPYCQAPRGRGISVPGLPKSANRRNTSRFHTLRQAEGDRSELWYCRLQGGKQQQKKKKKKGAVPRVCHAAQANDENSPSWAKCQPITETYLQWRPVHPLPQSDAQLHIVSDNKATSVETLFFPFLFKEMFSAQAAEVEWAAPGGDTVCHICYPETHELGWSLCRGECLGETRASVHSLRLLPPRGPYGWSGRLSSTCLYLLASKKIWGGLGFVWGAERGIGVQWNGCTVSRVSIIKD